MTSDFFLEEADEWRPAAWSMIRERADLHFVIITKRIHRFLVGLPADWGEGYEHVTICCTCENQKMADNLSLIHIWLYASLRLLFSRIGTPHVGTASYFSFNDPNGMCRACSGLGKVTRVDVEALLDPDKSWNEGCVKDSLYRPGSWYWKQYAQSGLFDLDKPVKEYTREEYNPVSYTHLGGPDKGIGVGG